MRNDTAVRIDWRLPGTCLALCAAALPAQADNGNTLPVPELQAAITIEADGSCTDAEWPSGSSVLEVCLSGQPCVGNPADPAGKLKLVIDHPDDPIAEPSLYLYLAVSDNSVEASGGSQDNAVLMFDLDNGHATGGGTPYLENSVRGVRVLRGGDVARVQNDITAPGVQLPSAETPAIDPARVCVASTATGWTVEARLLPGDFGRSDFKVFTAAALRVTNINSPSAGGSGFSSFSDWPASGAATMLNWDHLLTRAPIDYVLLVDQSGSMFGDKWTSAKAAGNHLREVLVQLHDATLTSAFADANVTGGGDRIGLATFSSFLAGNADTNRALAAVGAAPADYTGVLPANPGGATPMADGVNETFSILGGAANLASSAHPTVHFPRQKVVVMLSDGMHNVPSTTLNFDQQGAAFDFDFLPHTPDCDLVSDPDSPVHVHTVALGTDATVDTGKLDQIKNCFSGQRFTGIYNISGATAAELTAQLTNFYFTTLLPYYQLNALVDPGSFSPGMSFTVRPGERNLLAFAFWPDAGSVTSLSVTDPAAGSPPATCPAGTGYCYLSIASPAAGEYTNLTAAGAVGVYVLLDLQVEARFGFDNAPHGTSSTITLRARLQEHGQPLLGATVTVDVTRPQEGFGTFASTQSLNGCARVEPALPSVKVDTKSTKAGFADVALAFDSPNLNLQVEPTAGDVKPPPFALMESLLRACGKQALDRADDAGLALVDDGTQGDETAGDGVYTLRFENTKIEGSYLFRFRARGNDSAGRPFERVEQRSEYVRLDVDPGSTVIGTRDLLVDGTQVVREYTVVPRDQHGGYLGPGHAQALEFAITGAQPIGGVRDYNNGIYAQIVAFDRSKGEPGVVPVVQGKPVPSAPCDDGSGGPGGLHSPLVYLLLAVIALLLVLLILCWRSKR